MRSKFLKRSLAFIVACSVVAGLVIPTASFAWVSTEDDQSDLTEAQINSSLANGEVDLSAVTVDGENAQADSSYAMSTIAGGDRYETSAAEALSSFSSASTVVVASGESYADSTAGAGLAGALDAPILLTSPSYLPGSISDAIKTLKASNVIILGGTSAVSSDVENALRGIVSNIERLWGDTRYDTQLQIVSYGLDHGLWTGDTAAVVYAEGFADALSFSPVAFSLKTPVFFTDCVGSLRQEELDALKACGMKKAFLVGGTTVVSAEAENALKNVCSVTRLGGAHRYETSYNINLYAVKNLGFTWDYVAFSSGQAPWDSLGGGSMQGKKKRLLSLLDNGGAKTEPSVYTDGKPSHVVFLGGRNVYSNAFKAQVAYKEGYKITDIQGFKVYVDAGHGWNSSNNNVYDSGATGCGYQEASLTQELADKVSTVLKNTYGISTYVNKEGWYKLRQAQASELDCGLFLSIHFNAGGGSGSESYIHTVNAAWGSKHLQSSLTGRLANAVGLNNRGEEEMQLAVCSGKIPATLVEVCFIDRQSDMSAYQARKDSVARALAEGVVAW